MIQISSLIEAPRKTYRSERDFYMQELYSLYLQENPLHRKKANIRRYKAWLAKKGLRHSYQNALMFKTCKEYIKPFDLATFAKRLSYRMIKTKELPELVGLAKEKRDKGESIGGWLFAN